jgi:hydroxymethylpyrimidine/phosphomethylpyrimidine kinase
VYGVTAITAVTAQNTLGVTMVEALSADLVTSQIEAVVSDIGVHAAKTGMLANAAIVESVAATVKELDIPLLVVDPVMVAKSGDRLLDDDAIGAMKSELLALAFVVTPNIPEAEALIGMTIRTADDRQEAARRIHDMGPVQVVIKGGHVPDGPIVDLLYDGKQFRAFESPRIESRHTHGTGCTFSAALAAHLAHGRALDEAIPLAQRYVAGAIQAGLSLGQGNGPMDHFWRDRADRAGRM